MRREIWIFEGRRLLAVRSGTARGAGAAATGGVSAADGLMKFCRTDHTILLVMTPDEYRQLTDYAPGITEIGQILAAAGPPVELMLSLDAWDTLLLSLGYATAEASLRGDAERFWGVLRFVNLMNAGNSQFTPYEIPEDTSVLPGRLSEVIELRQVEKEKS